MQVAILHKNMPNESTELQTTEKEKTALERLSDNPFFKVGFVILGGLGAMTTFLNGIEKFILPLFKLPILTYIPDWAGVVGASLFVVAGLTLYFFSLRPKIKSFETEINLLTETKEVLEAENKLLKEAKETLEKVTFPFEYKTLIEVKHRKFANEKVVLDGHSFSDCTFRNVTFIYNGTNIFYFQHNLVKGSVLVQSENKAVTYAFQFMKGWGFLKDGVPILDENERPLNGIKPPIYLKATETPAIKKESKNQTEPKIEIVFDINNGRYLKDISEPPNWHQKVFIGIKNLTDEPIEGLKVYIEHIRGLDEHNIPLREKNDTVPYKQIHTLNPRAELFFYLGECSTDRVFIIYHALTDIEPFRIPPYQTQLAIGVEGNNILPFSESMSFMWKTGLVGRDWQKKPSK